MEVCCVGGDISAGKTKAFISHAFMTCSVRRSLNMLIRPQFRNWTLQCNCPRAEHKDNTTDMQDKACLKCKGVWWFLWLPWLEKNFKPMTEWEQISDKDF